MAYISRLMLFLVLLWSAAARGLPHDHKSHTELIESEYHHYTIQMGGNVDMDHAMTRQYDNWQICWQPNETIIIENIGDVPVLNARLIANGRGNWYSLDGIVQEAIQTASDSREASYLIWNFVRSNRYHHDHLWDEIWRDEEHDMVKMLSMYGGGLCDDSARVSAMIFYHANMLNHKYLIRGLHGHIVSEWKSGNRWQFMDTDENAFYLDRENEYPVSGDDVERDHELALREAPCGPIFDGWKWSARSAARFGGGDEKFWNRYYPAGRIDICLRSQERVEFRWDNIGKLNTSRKSHDKIPFYGNSRKIFIPRLDAKHADAQIARNISLKNIERTPVVTPSGSQAELIYTLPSAFVIAGGKVKAAFDLSEETDSASVSVMRPDNEDLRLQKFVEIWKSAGPGIKQAEVDIDKALKTHEFSPEYEFQVRIRLHSPNNRQTADLKYLEIQADTLVSPLFLPRLRLGENKWVYTDNSPDDRKVRVTHYWKETTAVTLPMAPKLINPENVQTIHEDTIHYKWHSVNDAKAYHLQVCRDPQMRWPYRPSLDMIHQNTTEFAMPSWGLYAPDTTYYWRVRTQDKNGFWGDWSDIQTFTWAGPRVPVKVELTNTAEGYLLTWKPNPRGARPTAYEVYGSDLKGFPVHKKPFELLGEHFTANYVGTTTATQMLVAGDSVRERHGSDVEFPDNLNRCYYRVAAVDRHGTPSGCSDYAEMPHPFIISKPVTSIRGGQFYSYQPQAISSLGDMQHRNQNPQQGLFFKEILHFALVESPDWLEIAENTGTLSGRVPPGSTGQYPVLLRLTASFEERTGSDAEDMPTPPDKIHEQEFILEIQ